MAPPVILIAGPTASGKSDLALGLAARLGGVVINADSMQLYRELRILTARPGAEEEARAPHRLYGVIAAAEACSAARWREMAFAEIREAREAGRAALLVGGTGLYFRALTEGLAPVPDIPEPVRRAARALLARLGPEALHGVLTRRDPEMAARLAPGDGQRLVRAWEVIEATGTSLAEWQALPPTGPVPDGPVVRLVLAPSRQWLYARCDARFEAMVAAGAVDEVAALLALGLDPELPAMKALGVRELRAHLEGSLDLAEAVARAQTATRRYAKRQITWFRHQMADATVIAETDPAARLALALAVIEAER